MAAVFGGCEAVHQWNESYRQAGLPHPITLWLKKRMRSEGECRDDRILSHYTQLKKTDRRLKQLHYYFPSLQPRNGLDYDFGPIEQNVREIKARRGLTTSG